MNCKGKIVIRHLVISCNKILSITQTDQKTLALNFDFLETHILEGSTELNYPSRSEEVEIS